MTTYHQQQISGISIRLQKTRRICNLMFTLKIVTFLLAAGEVYLCTQRFGITDAAILAILAILYFLAYYLDIIHQEKSENLQALMLTHENEIKALQGDFSPFMSGEEYINKSHEYTFDLDIFGKDSLFNRICRCTTNIGKERLAQLLQNISTNPDEIKRRMEAVAEIGEEDKGKAWISQFITHAYTEGHIREVLPLIATETENDKAFKKFTSWKFAIAWSLYLCVFWLLLILGTFGLVPYSIVSLLFLLNLVYAVTYNKRLKRLFTQAVSLRREFKDYTSMLQEIQGREFRSAHLKTQYETLFNDRHNAILAFKSVNRILTNMELRSHGMVFFIGEGFFLIGPLLVRQFLKWKQKYMASLSQWTDAIAEFDAYASMGNYAMNHPHNRYAVPAAGNEFHITAKAVHHPFLTSGKAVPNDFIQHNNEIFIITGANMAGKSTMLRTVGITMVMSSCGMPVCAESFEYVPTLLFSNMRTSDDLSRNISYFNAELLRLEQLITYCKGNTHTYIILDEILKGTNSEDKLKGSLEFLRYIIGKNVTGIVATHDLAISELESASPHFHNYCFEIETGTNITYSYKMTPGVARNMNATYLLKKILV